MLCGTLNINKLLGCNLPETTLVKIEEACKKLKEKLAPKIVLSPRSLQALAAQELWKQKENPLIPHALRQLMWEQRPYIGQVCDVVSATCEDYKFYGDEVTIRKDARCTARYVRGPCNSPMVVAGKGRKFLVCSKILKAMPACVTIKEGPIVIIHERSPSYDRIEAVVHGAVYLDEM